MPVAIAAPTRSASFEMSSPESASAWRAAATISCANRSMRRACLWSIQSPGIEVLHLARERDRVVGGVELRDRRPRRTRRAISALPRRPHVVAERRQRTETGDDDAPAPVDDAVVRAHIPIPPSTSSTSPVMNEASSEQRKRTAPAMSSGSPSRPSGVFGSIAAVASSGRTSVSCVVT